VIRWKISDENSLCPAPELRPRRGLIDLHPARQNNRIRKLRRVNIGDCYMSQKSRCGPECGSWIWDRGEKTNRFAKNQCRQSYWFDEIAVI